MKRSGACPFVYILSVEKRKEARTSGKDRHRFEREQKIRDD